MTNDEAISPNRMTVWLHEYMRSFGEVLKCRREALGLSQAALASQCHLHRLEVEGFEQGLASPNLFSLFALSKVLGVGVGQMLNEVDVIQGRKVGVDLEAGKGST